MNNNGFWLKLVKTQSNLKLPFYCINQLNSFSVSFKTKRHANNFTGYII